MANLQTQITSLEALITKANALPFEKKIQDVKTATPTKSVQTVSPDSGYDGISFVTVEPIPDEYVDASVTTIPYPYYVAEGEVYVDANGITQTGGLQTDYVVITNDDGSNHVNAQLVSAASADYGFMYIDGDELGNALPQHVLEGHTFTGANGTYIKESGTMPNNGDTSQTIDGLETKSVTIPEGYTTGGTVTVDDTVDNIADTQANLLEQIQSALQGKSVPGGGVEACTLLITSRRTDYDYEVYYNSVENGNIVTKVATNPTNITCVCGSMIVFNVENYTGADYTGLEPIASQSYPYPDTNYISYTDVRPYRITASAGEIATIYLDVG